MPNAGDLRCYVTLQRRKAQQNALDEKTYDYENWRSFWAQITPFNGRTETIAGDMDRAETTHRIVCRAESIGKIVDIDATIICERDSHKGIIIGKQGAMLKKIGSAARYEIENMLEQKVNLKVWVKVKKDWRDSDYLIKNFGYDKKEIE